MFDQFRNKFPIDDDKWIEYTGSFKRLEVPAKTVLIEEGEIPKKVFLIEKGCVRAWFNNSGKDITIQFFFENSAVASIESFRKKRPSTVTVETLEQTVLWVIQKKDIDRIIAEISEIPAIREMFTDAIFERTFVYMKHHISFIKDPPQQRYLKLIQDTPQVVQRVPQHYIASYLGISTVHLSRIKSQLVREKS